MLPAPFTMHGGRRFTVQEYLTEAKEKAPEFMTYGTLSRCIVYKSDLNAKLPYLSAYMGHAGLSSTQQYLRLTAEAFPHIVSAMEHNFDVFPGKGVEL